MGGGFEEWARARTPALLRSAYLLAGDQHSAEDLVQATLERVALAWSRVEQPDAYARRVMYRLQIRRWRRQRGRERLTSQPPERGHGDQAGEVELRMVVAASLRRLTDKQRAVLVLRFYEDLSEADIASVLGCAVGTVKSQTYKALRALREAAPELADLVGRRLATDV